MDVEGKRAERSELERRRATLKAGNNLLSISSNHRYNSSSKTDYGLGAGESNGKLKLILQQKLESAFKSMETSYLRQIALIDTTGKKSAEVTEQQNYNLISLTAS